VFGLPAGSISLPFDPRTGQFVTRGATVADFSRLGIGAGKTSLGFLGHLFGIDVASALDLAENDGLITTLAQPNLTALSGETASFLAGGEFPVLISTALGQTSILYKQYGVSLAFSPTVLADGRISMRVRPEVSELSSEGSITLNGYNIPGLQVRRAETTVELGSGQSFMIGGLLSNNANNSTDKVPGLGNLPILGVLFRSNNFRKQQTELVIVVTPYIVRPTDASDIHLPTDGYQAPTDIERVFLGKTFGGKTGAVRPLPKAEGDTVTVPSTIGGK
jgi:pilus assembly protein CpaC